MSDDPTKKLPRTPDEMFGEILNRLERLETSVDQRLKQTAPLSAQLAELLERMETGFRETNERHDRTEKELREINRTLRRMNVDLATALRDQDELGDRITALETQMSQP
jgi:septal ring factor EnvC (AmiA/AmiB activator)